MRDPRPRWRVRRVHIGDKGACGSIRPLMEPRNHAVSYWRCEPGALLCIRFGHRGRFYNVREGDVRCGEGCAGSEWGRHESWFRLRCGEG